MMTFVRKAVGKKDIFISNISSTWKNIDRKSMAVDGKQ